MTDQWTEVLQCPRCKTKGSANLSHAKGAKVPIVPPISVAFEVERTEYGPVFSCRACDVPVA